MIARAKNIDLRSKEGMRGTPRKNSGDDQALRSELYSAEQMEQHGKILAATHKLSQEQSPDKLLLRLAENASILNNACDLLTVAVRAKRRITPASEWLLDNFYLIEEQIRTAKKHLPEGYSRQLPRLANAKFVGVLRVYEIALATISHGDGRVDPENLSRFVASYQTVAQLKLGELWAIPIMLRLALIENLRRAAIRIAAQMVERDLANNWADKMMDVVAHDPKSLILVIADMARSNPPMVSSFVSELSRRLSGQGTALALGLTWIEQRLSESNITIEQMIQLETQVQAADQVSISNTIGSLRFLGGMDWRKFVESQSIVEQILCEDNTGVYSQMDFATRDQYRHVVERLGKKSPLTEGQIAQSAISLAGARVSNGAGDDRYSHVGYFLVGAGLADLERAAAVQHSALDLLKKFGRDYALLLYLGAIILSSCSLSAILVLRAYDEALSDWIIGLFAFSTLICSSQLAIALINFVATLMVPSRALPKMDLSKGIPATARTLVVVPTMLAHVDGVAGLIEGLEVRYLANRDENLHFALLTDFLDAASETMPQDEQLVVLAKFKIDELNQKYKTGSEDIFFLFHRPRKWNVQENVWMGYERKRGKLGDLNSVLRGGSTDCFSLIEGNIAVLSSVKYVITLDTDTELPRDAAKELVGAMIHPLNRAHYDEATKLVTAGYGILQPRVAVSLPCTTRSRYAAMNGNDPGIDPYTRTVSDVYQDVFREGSFIGKGIYDLNAFEASLKGRFPENRILSHDLLEGCYARSGLLSDVQFYEDYPASYSADANRRHRWIRGDWQLCRWLLSHVFVSGLKVEQNPLSTLSRCKILDNLRRSLLQISLTLMLIIAWTALSPVWFWNAAALSILFMPPLFFSLLDVLRKPDDVMFGQHFSNSMITARRQFGQAMFSLTCLPYEACFSLDAIVRTIMRMSYTRKNLLAWNPSGEVQRKERSDLIGSILRMASAPLIASAVIIYLFAFRPMQLAYAWPILLLWFVSPAIAWWISKPLAARAPRLGAVKRLFLDKIARRTWAFFETFVNKDENWLPPDNVQELPYVGPAHRTSPTNMGLALLANLTAYDFGYIQCGQLLDRTQNTLKTMHSLERHRGHLYNWYDTLSLKPLWPRYISTVDSGNLGGHLITLNSGLNALAGEKIVSTRIFDGFLVTLSILKDCLDDPAIPEVLKLESDLKTAQAAFPRTVFEMRQVLEIVTKSSGSVVERLVGKASDEANAWAARIKNQAAESLADLLLLAPWSSSPDLPAALSKSSKFERIPSLQELTQLFEDTRQLVQNNPDSVESAQDRIRLDEFLVKLSLGSRNAQERIAKIDKLVLESADLSQMEYEFLFDKERRLLAIGYNTDDRRVDQSFYDLLASEARLCNFVAIAQGQLAQETWFCLGRLLTSAAGEPVLCSWSGSMFEYLMPLLVMPTYSNTLLDQTYQTVVKRQIEYGKQRNIPWGISESGFYAFDVHLNYQYRAFGVPGLGLKRGLSQDLVIAPYATALALMVAPEEACSNLERMASEGFVGEFGFYEAVDYTPSRIPRGRSHAVVQSFMVHHQGMTLLSLAYLLLDQPMQKRFENEPSFQATTLLLQEKILKSSAFHSLNIESAELRNTDKNGDEASVRFFNKASTAVPEIQLLSNGRYHVMMSNSGGGYSRWKEFAVTRWREDSTCDNWGSFCYVRDSASGEFWSTAFQPTLKKSETYEAIFSEARVEFRRRDGDIDTHTEIVVSSEDDIELRRVRVTNRSRFRKTIDLTSYAEVVLTDAAHDALHPAFSNLFVQTEILEERQAIICNRRPRSADEHLPWMFHLMAIHEAKSGKMSYETDRMRFIGRGNSLVNPEAMFKTDSLSNSSGSVLDPIVSIRCPITLEPEESATVNIVTGIAESRLACLTLIEKYQDRRLADRVFDVAWTHSQVVLRQLNATEADGQMFAKLGNSVVYANQSLRADPGILIKNKRGQSGLWGYAISGDLPIVLLQIRDIENIELVRQLVQAHAYWRLKGLSVDLVIWNEDRTGYRQLIQEQIMSLIAAGVEANVIDKPGGIFVRAAEQISTEDRILLQSVARIIIKDSLGTLADQISGRKPSDVRVPRLEPTRLHRLEVNKVSEPARSDLILFNGLGGFTSDGREYVITTAHGHVTPAPWVNVIANPYFGTVISESGLAYTWLENSHEFRLTPWNNDPVTDSAGEAYYIRDEETGYFWSPCPLPVRGATPYITRHGFGYSVFEHTEVGITTELTVYVVNDAPVKIAAIKVRNDSGRPRQLSATAFVEWVLGDLRSNTAMHVVTEIDAKSGALFASNPYNTDFPNRVAFLDVDESNRSLTGDRTEFLGRNRNMADPAAMSRQRLSGKVGPGLDPCAALQVPFELQPGQEREIIFRLGVGQDSIDANNLVNRFRGAQVRRDTFESLCEYWKHTLGTVNVDTPDRALNMLANGWLLYQTISCRLWGRSGYYQSGGAFGFRDQLQDSMALVHAEPQLLRKQLLLCASRQFIEGDVQHWWHPPSGRGVRTHCSDDYLWLPLAACRYVMTNGDTGVLNEQVHFLTGRAVNPKDDSYYDLPGRSEESASLYEHCKRAILHGLRFGAHGLPLMGGGDWNDGMNLVGAEGLGESVWLGFFLYEVLHCFGEMCRKHGDEEFALVCETNAAQLQKKIETTAWDGEWYRRAYFDDGSVLGTESNPECKIDSISQSWSVLSGVASDKRRRQAMNSLVEHLVDSEHSLVKLLAPPFDKSEMNPGYIKGYVPGVRENGGQYTHAAIWATMAFAALGDNRRAWDLWTMINPVNHGSSEQSIDVYKVEPYVVAADVYAVPPHTGRGGWTWYTGSASWMYRLITESLLGLRLNVDRLHFSPCLPDAWPQYKVHYRFHETIYHITVLPASDDLAEHTVSVDGVMQNEPSILLIDDRRQHAVEVRVPYKSNGKKPWGS